MTDRRKMYTLYRIKTREFAFLSAWIVYLLTLMLDLTAVGTITEVDSLLKYVRYLCYITVALKILWDGFYDRQIWQIFTVSVLVVLMVIFSEAREYLFYLFMLIAAKDVNCHKIIKTTLFVQGFFLSIVVIASQMGITEDYLFDATTRARHGLGFNWTTTAPILFFFWMMSYVYLRRERMRWYEYLLLEIVNYWFYAMTNTRFSFYLSSLMLIYVFVMSYYWQNRKDTIRKNRWLIFAPGMCCVSAILMHLLYDSENDMWSDLNTLLSGRLSLGKSAWEEYGFSFFGHPIEWVGFGWTSSGGTYNYVDCSYMQILLECGVIFLILVVAAYTYMMYMAVKTKDFYLQTVILFIVVFSITEPRLLNLRFNPFPVFVMASLGLGNKMILYTKNQNAIRKCRVRSVQIKLKDRC